MAEELLKRNNQIQKDIIIVGQGIAGSVLALSFIKAGYSICVINQSNLSSSSKVAAGIWNPVVFKRLTKSWLADELVPALKSFYHWAEEFLNASFTHQRLIVKAFGEKQEQDFWQKKAVSDNHFLDPTIYHDLAIDEKTTIQNYSNVLQAGYINLPLFIEETKKHLQQHHTLIEEAIDYSMLTHSSNGVTYKNISAKQIVFCEGHLVSQNPYFNTVPLKPAKGEVLTISSEHFLWKDSIINKGFFILPLGNNFYKVGATYEWNELNDLPTEQRKAELCKKIDSLITTPYTIVKHEAGVRPSSIDRRPIIGSHPTLQNYYIFNGLGTKGVMLAPYFAKQTLDLMINKIPVHHEVDLKRFDL